MLYSEYKIPTKMLTPPNLAKIRSKLNFHNFPFFCIICASLNSIIMSSDLPGYDITHNNSIIKDL